MAKEILHSAETSNLESQINSALSGFKSELSSVKASIEKGQKDQTWSVETMKTNLEATKSRIENYITVNGEIIKLKDLVVVDTIEKEEIKNGKNVMTTIDVKAYKMTYTVTLGGVDYEIPSFFKVVNTKDNDYIQFQVPPGQKQSAVEKEWAGKIYDINIIKEKAKDLDIRIQYNEQKTDAKILEKINAFVLKKGFKIEKDTDPNNNTQITGLNNVELGKEIVKIDGGYYKSIFLSENNKYRELGKVYFDVAGEVDKTKTQNTEFKILEVPLTLSFDLTKNTFTIEGLDALKAKITTHRKALKDLLTNSSVADPDVFEGLSDIGTTWNKTKNIGLFLIDDTYTIQWGKTKGDVLRFGFDTTDKLSLKDLIGTSVDSFVLPVTVDNEIRLYDVSKLESKLQIKESQAKEFQTVKELPELEDAPASLNAKNLYVYNREDSKKLEYFTPDGKLVAAIPSSKTQINTRQLGNLTQDVNTYDLFREYAGQFPAEMLKNMNIFENDIYKLFSDLFTKKITISARPVLKVLEGDMYRYYHVDQKKSGEPFVFEKDEELYEAAKIVIDQLKMNLQVLETLSKTELKYRDEDKESDFKTFKSGLGIGLLDVATADKLAFLQKERKDEKKLSRTLIYGNGKLNGGTDVKTLNFIIKKDDITLEGKKKNEVTIETQNFQIRSEYKDNQFALRFDTIQ